MVMAPSAIAFQKTYLPIYRSNGVTETKVFNHGGDHTTQNTKSASDLIGEAFKEKVSSIDTNTCQAGEEDAFFVADMGEVYRQHLRWKLHLPRVKPFYAVKCNSDPQVLRLLAELGTGFDCASKSEIETALNLGIDPSRVIYAQPCKTKSYIRYAEKEGVKQMTFDNADELYKVKELFPDAELFLRIMTDDSTSLCRLSCKFGASLDSTIELLSLAKALDLNVVGLSFHVGSGASDPQAFVKAVQDSRIVFDQAAELGFDMKILDVGGGFCTETFERMANVLSEALDEYFPPYVHIIAEPGRFYVSSAFTLACNVISRRDVYDPSTRSSSYMLYLNDGVYGNFSSIMFDHQHPVPRVLSAGGSFIYKSRDYNFHESPGVLTDYSIWGPTCDGIDVIAKHCAFSELIEVGDWLYFEDMGAYTKCSATRFNGFTDNHEVVYISSELGAAALLKW